MGLNDNIDDVGSDIADGPFNAPCAESEGSEPSSLESSCLTWELGVHGPLEVFALVTVKFEPFVPGAGTLVEGAASMPPDRYDGQSARSSGNDVPVLTLSSRGVIWDNIAAA